MIQDITYTVRSQDVDLTELVETVCNCDKPFKIFGLPCIESDRTLITGVCLETGDKLTLEIVDDLIYVYEPLEQSDQFSERFVATLQDYIAQSGGTIRTERSETKLKFNAMPLEEGFAWCITGGDRNA